MKKTSLYMGKGHMMQSYYTIYDKCVIDCEKMQVLRNENEIGNIDIWSEKFLFGQKYQDMFRLFFQKSCELLGNSFEWLEFQIEILKKRDNVVRSNGYIGGNIRIGKKRSSIVHIGVVGEQMDVMMKKLAQKADVVIKWSNMSQNIEGNNFYLDPYSTSVLIHEVIGHYAEEQVNYNWKDILDNIDVNDEPNGLLDYSIDDLGTEGKRVHIVDQHLSDDSGNVFISINNDKIVTKKIRQRNIDIFTNNCGEMSKNIPNLFICKAGINVTKEIIAMIIKDGVDVKQIIIPISDIELLVGKGGNMFRYANVCIKEQAPHYIGYNSIWSELYLKKNINFYIK